MKILFWLVVFLFLLDMTLTHLYVHQYKSKQPDKSYAEMEKNVVLKYTWDKFGFGVGGLIGVVFIGLLLITALYYGGFWVQVGLGLIYSWAVVNHINNLILLRTI